MVGPSDAESSNSFEKGKCHFLGNILVNFCNELVETDTLEVEPDYVMLLFSKFDHLEGLSRLLSAWVLSQTFLLCRMRDLRGGDS